MKVAAFGSCMSNLTIACLKSEYGFEQTHSVHHNRSDAFLRYYVEKSAAMVPLSVFDRLLREKPESHADARQMLLNQYPDHIGFHDLRDRQASTGANFLDDLQSQTIDVFLMDNFMDVAAKLMVFKNNPKYCNSPFFITCGLYLNEPELVELLEFDGDYLTAEQSAENNVRIYRWLRALQPQAKFFFLPFQSCSSLTVPERFRRTRDFYPALVRAAAGEDLHIIPPLEVAPELTKGEIDWPHFQWPIYRALAGHVYLATVAGLPSPRERIAAMSEPVNAPEPESPAAASLDAAIVEAGDVAAPGPHAAVAT